MAVDTGRVLALIPARAGSKGIPGKNVRPLAGRPLIAHTIEQALASTTIDAILVSTDSVAIANMAQASGAKAPFLRPAQLSTDEAATYPVVQHAINEMLTRGHAYEYVVVLEPTSPLRRPETIDAGVRRLAASDASALVSICRAGSHHPDNAVTMDAMGQLRPLNGRQPNGVRRQTQSAAYYPDGCLYAARTASLDRFDGFYRADTIGLVVSRCEALEIDEPEDFELITALLAGISS